MKNKSTVGIIVTVAMLSLSSIASAESWICEQGDLMREIVVKRESTSPAPCSVVYNKETENQASEILWSAQFDGAYCDARADGLADKLAGYGWTCTEFHPQ